MPPDTTGMRIFHTGLAVLLSLLPAIVAYAILYRQAFTVPYQDDYHAILAFSAKYQQLPTWKQKVLAIAAEQHNEYKLGFEHSVVAADLELTHHLNFLFLAAFGDLTLLPTAYLLWLTYGEQESDPSRRLLKFLPISFLFFALTYWETLNWAMTGLQNVPVILFSLLAIYLLIQRQTFTPSRGRLLLACVAAGIAASTSANGFLLAPVGLLLLLPRRAYTRALLWCLSFVPPLGAYLYHSVPSVEAMNPYYYLTRPLFFFAFLGGVVPFRWLAALFGLVVAAVLLLSLRSRFDRTNPVASYFVLWILASAGLVAWVRGAAGVSVASRYSIYSILLLIFCYSFLAHYLSTRSSPVVRRWFYAIAVVATMAFCFASDVRAYHKLAARRSMVLAGIQFYCSNPAVNSPSIDPLLKSLFPKEPPYERDILIEAMQQGMITLPCSENPQER